MLGRPGKGGGHWVVCVARSVWGRPAAGWGVGQGPLARLGQPDGISPSRMAEMLEVDKAGPIVRC
jgi:hypothetical protein